MMARCKVIGQASCAHQASRCVRRLPPFGPGCALLPPAHTPELEWRGPSASIRESRTLWRRNALLTAFPTPAILNQWVKYKYVTQVPFIFFLYLTYRLSI